ncbi:MAG: hypothetical protein ACE5LU_28980 [Anaerolineae bacterium]
MKTVYRLIFVGFTVILFLSVLVPQAAADPDPVVKAWSANLNVGREEYFIIWHDGESFFGHFVRDNGLPKGGIVKIGGKPGAARTIELAFNSRRGEWFFIWNDGENIMGQHLHESTGTMKGNPFVVVPGVAAEPELSINAQAQWLIGWPDADGNWWNQTVDNVGSARRGPPILAGTGGIYGQPADYAPGRRRDEHQLVWSVGNTIYAQMFFASGHPKGGPYVLLENGLGPDIIGAGVPLIFRRDGNIYSLNLFEGLLPRGRPTLGLDTQGRKLAPATFRNARRGGKLMSLISDGNAYYSMEWFSNGLPIRGTFGHIFNVPQQ